jgi:hypothetical protein
MKPQVYETRKESKHWWTLVLDKFGKMKKYNISFRRHSKKIKEIPKRNHKTK